MRMKKRNQSKMNSYKERYGYHCMYPGCPINYGIDTHHIIPLSRNGIDDRRNYICLCENHHRRSQIHSQYLLHDLTLATWKYWFEASFGDEEDVLIKPEKVLSQEKMEDLNDVLLKLDLIQDKINSDPLLGHIQKVHLENLINFTEQQILKRFI